MNVGLDVVVDGRRFGERGEDVERRQRPCRRLNPRRLGGDGAPQLVEDLQLAFDDALVGAQHLLFVFLQRRRDESLAAGDGLLAMVVGWHGVQVRLRDFDVVAEYAVEANLERRDAGAGPFPAPRAQR